MLTYVYNFYETRMCCKAPEIGDVVFESSGLRFLFFRTRTWTLVT